MNKYNLERLEESFIEPLREILADIDGIEDSLGTVIICEKGEQLSATLKNGTCMITYNKRSEFFRAVSIINSKMSTFKEFTIKEKCHFETLCLMADNSRNAVFNISTAKTLIRLLSRMGYTALELYTEDTYEVSGEPYFGYLRGRYTQKELKELDLYALGFGIELIPCIQTLAHLKSIMRWKTYGEINDCNDILLVGDDRTYALIDNMLKTLSECFSSRRVNIGMDESHMLGLGKYLEKNGYQNRFDIMNAHLNKVIELCNKYKFKPAMWSDMFFRFANNGIYCTPDGKIDSEAIKKTPTNIDLIYWDYYSTSELNYDNMITAHKQFKNDIQFAGGAWKWIGFVPDNRFALHISKLALNSCIKNGIKNVLVTAWGDNGAETSIFAIMPTLVYYSERAYGSDSDESFKKAFKRIAGCKLEDFMAIDLPNRQSDSENPLEINNSSKIFLYNDLFMGIFDCIADKNSLPIYQKNILLLKKISKKVGKYKYIFDTAIALLNVIIHKYYLGIKTRESYNKKDNKSLTTLVGEYQIVYNLINKFYAVFKKQWLTENKPHGFDIQDIRIGGLLNRVKSCKDRLSLYLDGTLDKIDELEDESLDFYGNEKYTTNHTTIYNFYEEISSANVLNW